MAIDLPMVVYPKNRKEKSTTIAEMDALTEAWEKKHKASRVGETISIGDFLDSNLERIIKG